ncbi:MAG: serine dehydratase, partial [Bacteroidales bacterium]|nr:serine dehydratase [Bacteroidales bacterium]
MESIKELYRIGHGPSSSHTMGPRFAAERFKKENPGAASFRVTLYGSLAATGKGHLTDATIIETFLPEQVEFVWKPEIVLPFHTNGMKFEALDVQGNSVKDWMVYSVGGGKIMEENQDDSEKHVYEHNSMSEIMALVEQKGQDYWEYVKRRENSDTWDYLFEVWKAMKRSIQEGLDADGVLPGGLNLRRKASAYWIKAKGYRASLRSRSMIMAYAMAVSEQNASGGVVVTAP